MVIHIISDRLPYNNPAWSVPKQNTSGFKLGKPVLMRPLEPEIRAWDRLETLTQNMVYYW